MQNHSDGDSVALGTVFSFPQYLFGDVTTRR